MEGIRKAEEGLSAKGWSFKAVDPPRFSESDCIRVLDACRTNYCGNYGTTWACPPGWTERMDALSARYGSALLMSKRFEGDPADKGVTGPAMKELKGAVRELVGAMRSEGIDCLGLADDECDVCPVCAYPGPCRHPDLLTPSVASAGIDMGSWFADIGEEFLFEKDAFELYGIVLYDGKDGRAFI